jgi:hypothetical protein
VEDERTPLTWDNVDRLARVAERVTGKTVTMIAGQAGTRQDATYLSIPHSRDFTPHNAFSDIVHELAHYVACTAEDRLKPNICFEGYEEGVLPNKHYDREEEIGAYVQVVMMRYVVGRTEDALLEAYHLHLEQSFEYAATLSGGEDDDPMQRRFRAVNRPKALWAQEITNTAKKRIRHFERETGVRVDLLLAGTI